MRRTTMTHLDAHFIDPTIPGIGGRGLIERAVKAMVAACGEAASAYRATRQDFALRKGLSRLDRRQLRDIGLDRDTA